MGKVNKFWALYFPSFSKRKRCGTCSMFRPPDDCTKVAGPIHPDDVCRFWAAKS